MALPLPVMTIVGFIMLVAGTGRSDIVAFIGMTLLSKAIPVYLYICIVVGLSLAIMGKLGTKKTGEEVNNFSADDVIFDENGNVIQSPDMESSEADEPTVKRNGRRGYYQGQMEAGQMEIDMLSQNYRNSSTKQKIFGLIFFYFLMADFGLILVFALFLSNTVGALVCAGIFAATIIIALITNVVQQKISMSSRALKKGNAKILEGTVLSCTVASTTSVNNRVTKIVYYVVIGVGGDEYKGYCKESFNEGASVKFADIGRFRAAGISGVGNGTSSEAESAVENSADTME